MIAHMPSLRRALPGTLPALLVLLVVMFAPGPAAGATVTVGAGESLSAIAARNGVSVAALATANGIADPDHVIAGTRLTLPGPGADRPGAVAGGHHTVRAGETLSSIARRYGIRAATLGSANGLRDPNLIVAGSRLVIPTGAPVTPGGGAVVASGGRHTVTPGETLSYIAARYGMTTRALMAANGIADPDRIVAGRTLRVQVPSTASGIPAGYVGVVTIPRSEVAAMITAAAGRYGVDPALARAVAYQESGFNHNVRSAVGAIGAMQLMPYTAAWVGPTLVGRRLDPTVLRDNVDGGVAYLAWLNRRTGDPRQAAAGYYQGLNALRSRGMFDDTKRYVSSVMSLYGKV